MHFRINDLELKTNMLVSKTLLDYIDEYKADWGKEIEYRLKTVGELPESAFWDAVRCTKPYVPINMPHTNAWYFKMQTDTTGTKISLRDAFIQEARKRHFLNNTRLKTFADIFAEVQSICVMLRASGIKGIGQMTMYDVTLYIAARKNLEPKEVYIHRGVTKGAFALGLVPDAKRDYILPLQDVLNKHPELEALRKAKHIENFLCIYHNQLEAIAYDRRR